MISGVTTEIIMAEKYQRGTFDRSSSSEMRETASIKKAIAEKVRLRRVAT